MGHREQDEWKVVQTQALTSLNWALTMAGIGRGQVLARKLQKSKGEEWELLAVDWKMSSWDKISLGRKKYMEASVGTDPEDPLPIGP